MNKNINRFVSSSSNVWQDVKEDIEFRILTGDFVAGERVPSIRKLADSYGIGQSTAQKVLNVLLQEGIIESRRGVGYFVKPYIRESLIAERKRNLEKSVRDAVEEAAVIGVDLRVMVERYMEMIKAR